MISLFFAYKKSRHMPGFFVWFKKSISKTAQSRLVFPSFQTWFGIQVIYNPYLKKYRTLQPCTYIMASARNGTLYIGVTSDLIKRVYQHKNNFFEWFSKEYNTKMLVYFEVHETMDNAITRESQMKAWKRNWKKDLIEKDNPEWRDLYDEIIS